MLCNHPSFWGGLHDTQDHLTYTGSITISLVTIDDEGYDRCGMYYGLGDPVYLVLSGDGDVRYWIRASNPREAIAIVRQYYPLAQI
jgi:hypothetical protein